MSRIVSWLWLVGAVMTIAFAAGSATAQSLTLEDDWHINLEVAELQQPWVSLSLIWKPKVFGAQEALERQAKQTFEALLKTELIQQQRTTEFKVNLADEAYAGTETKAKEGGHVSLAVEIETEPRRPAYLALQAGFALPKDPAATHTASYFDGKLQVTADLTTFRLVKVLIVPDPAKPDNVVPFPSASFAEKTLDGMAVMRGTLTKESLQYLTAVKTLLSASESSTWPFYGLINQTLDSRSKKIWTKEARYVDHLLIFDLDRALFSYHLRRPFLGPQAVRQQLAAPVTVFYTPLYLGKTTADQKSVQKWTYLRLTSTNRK